MNLKLVFSCWWLIVFAVLAMIYANNTAPLPSGVHSWAQSDRYALACQYFEDGRFFAPKTYNLMSDDGRVGVEFPILPFVSAKVALLLGRQHLPWIMRALNAILLLLSLMLLASQMKGKLIHRTALITVLFFSPLLVFYGFNFLPDTTGLSVTLLAFAFFLRFIRHRRNVFWIMTLAVAAFATIVKTTCGIYFIAIGATLFIHFLKEKDYRKLIYLIISQIVITGIIFFYDYTYFFQVNKKLWSMIFMSQSQPILNSADITSVYKGFVYWAGQWITWSQAGVLVVIGLLLQFPSRVRRKDSLLLHLLLISLIGLLSFIGLMGKQFVNHDYYFIASVVPLIFLLGIDLNERVANASEKIQHFYPLVLSAALILTGFHSFGQYAERSGSHFTWKGRTILNEVKWMEDGDLRLARLNVPNDAIIFVLYEFAPNTALVYFNRKGQVFNHEEMSRQGDNLTYWKERINPDYIIIQRVWSDNFKRDQPDFYNGLKLYGSDGDMLVFAFVEGWYEER